MCNNSVHLPHALDVSIYLRFFAWKNTRSAINGQRGTDRKVRLSRRYPRLRTIRVRSTLPSSKLAIPYTSLEFRSAINKAGNFNLNQRCRGHRRGPNGSPRPRCQSYHMKMRRIAFYSDYRWRYWRKSSLTRARPSYSRSLVHQNIFSGYSAILARPSCGNEHG